MGMYEVWIGSVVWYFAIYFATYTTVIPSGISEMKEIRITQWKHNHKPVDTNLLNVVGFVFGIFSGFITSNY